MTVKMILPYNEEDRKMIVKVSFCVILTNFSTIKELKQVI